MFYLIGPPSVPVQTGLCNAPATVWNDHELVLPGICLKIATDGHRQPYIPLRGPRYDYLGRTQEACDGTSPTSQQKGK
jgi:hypothetical protein